MHNPGDYVDANIKGANAPANNKNKMSPKPHHMRSPSPVALGRSSFSSIRERDSDLAQTFTSSKISSYGTRNFEAAVSDESSAPTSPLPEPAAAGEIPTDTAMLLLPGQYGAVDFEYEAKQNDIAQSVVRSLAWLRTGSQDGSPKDTIKRQDSLPNNDRTQVDGSFENADVADTAMEDVEDVERTQTKQPFERLPIEVYRKFFLFFLF